MRKYYNNHIVLDGKVRELLLAGICRRENVIGMRTLDFMLNMNGGAT